MRPKLAQTTTTTTTAGVSSSSASVPSTSQGHSLSSGEAPILSGGVINPVFLSDHLVDSSYHSRHPPPPPPPPTKPKPTTTPIKSISPHLFQPNPNASKKPRSSSSSSSATQQSSSSSSNHTVLTSASAEAANAVLLANRDDNCRTLTTSSAEVAGSGTEFELRGQSSPSTSTSVKRRLTTSQQSDLPTVNSSSSCDFCYRFHVNNHHIGQSSRLAGGPIRRVSPSSRPYYYEQPPPQQLFQPYAPYPPQWYYLLGADSKQFRKHKHSHYRKDCKVCRQIVRQTFEQYYLGASSGGSMAANSGSTRDQAGSAGGAESPDSIVPMSLLSDHHSDPLLLDHSPSPLPLVFLPRRRASCGHSCLKYSILFYCSAAVILAICFICYLTRIFGYLETMPGVQFSSNSGTPVVTDGAGLLLPEAELLPTGVPMLLNSANESTVKSDILSIVSTTLSSITTTTTDPTPTEPFFSATTTAATPGILESLVRTEVVGLIVSSALMIIFFLGLVAAFLESILALRIFGAILSYLFLLTFGAALYTVILLLIAHMPAKLILSAVSCSAVAITLHAALAIAPFAFADLINQERQDEKNELASTSYFKYPSVRFLPSGVHPKHSRAGAGRRNSSYFSLSFLNSAGGRMWQNVGRGARMGANPYPLPSQSFHHQYSQHHRPHSSSTRTSPVESNRHQQMDNLSSEGLIPPVQQQQQQHSSTVRFNDNWI